MTPERSRRRLSRRTFLRNAGISAVALSSAPTGRQDLSWWGRGQAGAQSESVLSAAGLELTFNGIFTRTAK